MTPALHQPTETELKAHRRRAAFRASIETKAAELAASKLRAAIEATRPTPATVKPAPIHAAPIAADVLLNFPPMKEPWFSIEGATLVKPLTIRDIQIAVCDRVGMTLAEFLGERRNAPLVHARQVAMYLAKVLTGRSTPEIGRRFGGKDHTTILHAIKKIKRECGDDPSPPECFKVETADLVKSLREELEYCD
ncbi:helix-turn-helix domain-containing protein [Bradyrhizobium sp. B124]|uniref:helix-turn-helix domain-containing protein n=1 Tax=Bradyrhizobium sp. B124 TaxID=3140245 RepID=UPI0031831EC1